MTIHPAQSLPVPGVHGSALEVTVTLQPAEDATEAASVFLVSDNAESPPFGGGEAPADDYCSVAVTVSWQEQTLKVSGSHRAGCSAKTTLRLPAYCALVAAIPTHLHCHPTTA